MRDGRLFMAEVDGEQYYAGFFARKDIDPAALESISKRLRELAGLDKMDVPRPDASHSPI